MNNNRRSPVSARQPHGIATIAPTALAYSRAIDLLHAAAGSYYRTSSRTHVEWVITEEKKRHKKIDF